MTGEGDGWDYGAVPDATFSWDRSAGETSGDGGEVVVVHARVNSAGIRWTSVTSNPNHGGAAGIGEQTFAEFFRDGPPAAVDAAELSAFLHDRRRAVTDGHVAEAAAREPSGATALHRAASRGDDAEVARMLDAGASVDVRHTDSQATPLHGAAAMHHPSTVALLLSRGAAVDARTTFGETPLDLALRAIRKDGNGQDVVRVLLDAGADRHGDADERPLRLAAAYEGGDAIVRMLLDRGADAMATLRDGSTALHAGAGFPSVVTMLLAAGADPNARDRWSQTPLHFAVMAASPESIARLLAAGARADIENQRGETALVLASRYPTLGLTAAFAGRG